MRKRLTAPATVSFACAFACLGVAHESIRPSPQPVTAEAFLVLGVACLVCLIYLNQRIRAVEIVP